MITSLYTIKSFVSIGDSLDNANIVGLMMT